MITATMVSPAPVIPAIAVTASAARIFLVSPATLVFVVSPTAFVSIVSRAAAVVGFIVVIVTAAFSSRQMFQIEPMFGEDRRRFLLVALFLVVSTGARGTPVEVFPVVAAGNGSPFRIRTR